MGQNSDQSLVTYQPEFGAKYDAPPKVYPNTFMGTADKYYDKGTGFFNTANDAVVKGQGPGVTASRVASLYLPRFAREGGQVSSFITGGVNRISGYQGLKDVNTVGGLVLPIANKSAQFFSPLETQGRLLYENSPNANFRLLGKNMQIVGRGFTGSSEFIAGNAEDAANRPVTFVSKNAAFYTVTKGGTWVLGRTTSGAAGIAERSAIKRGASPFEAFNVRVRSGVFNSRVISAVGLGAVAYSEAGKSPRELGRDTPYIISGGLGAASGFSRGMGSSSVSIRQVSQSRITEGINGKGGFQTEAILTRKTDFSVTSRAFRGEVTEPIQQVVTGRISNQRVGSGLRATIKVSTTTPQSRIARSIGEDTVYRGRYNIADDSFVVRNNRQGFRSTSTFGELSPNEYRVISTTDVFGINNGRASYLSSSIATGNVKTEIIGDFTTKVVGTENPASSYKSQLQKNSPFGDMVIRRQNVIQRSLFPRRTKYLYANTPFGETVARQGDYLPIRDTALSPSSPLSYPGRSMLPSFGIVAPRTGSLNPFLVVPVGIAGTLNSAGTTSTPANWFNARARSLGVPRTTPTYQLIVGTDAPVMTDYTPFNSVTTGTPDIPSIFNGTPSVPSIQTPNTPPPPPVLPFPGLPAGPLWGFGRGSSNPSRRGRFNTRYIPDVTSGIYGIRGPRPRGPLISPGASRPLASLGRVRRRRR